MKYLERSEFMIAWAIRLGCLATLGLVGVTLTPTAAMAQDDALLKEKLASATEDYDILELDTAQAKLEEAIDHAQANGLRGPQVGKVHVMLGIVKFANGDNEGTEKAFIAGVEAYPQVQVPPVYETPELAAIMETARAKAKPPENNGNGGNNGGGGEFKHEPITRADGGKPLNFEVFVPETMPAFRVTLYHRRFGEETFSETEMKPTSSIAFAVDLPGDKVATSQIDYYIVIYNRNNDQLAASASDTDPHTVVVIGGGDVENPDGGNGKGKGKGKGKVTEPDGPVREESKNVYVMLGGGSGGGFLPGGSPTANPERSVSPGMAPAFGHALLDAGWIINSSMRLGLYFRWQFSPPQDFTVIPDVSKEGKGLSTRAECLGLGLKGDCLVGARYRYYLSGPNPDKVRVYSSVGLGVGRVRNWLRLKENAELTNGSDNPNCVGKDQFIDTATGENFCYIRDTVRPGWGHFGLGAGVSVPLAKVVEFTADTYLMFLTLDQTSINVDANLGFVFKF